MIKLAKKIPGLGGFEGGGEVSNGIEVAHYF
jgi:hypothetical protein